MFTPVPVLSILPRAEMAPAPSSMPRGVDGCSWTGVHAVSAYGVRVGVRADDVMLLQRLCERLPPGSRRLEDAPGTPPVLDYSYSVVRQRIRTEPRPDAADASLYVGLSGASPFVQTFDEASALDAFESTVRFDVAVTTTDVVFVHAGVAVWGDGAIVIPAPSMHGKSRLVDALVRAGARYYSDEFAVINQLGQVQPFAIPLSLRNDSGGVRRLTAHQPGPAPAVPIRLVVSTRYEADAEWRPRRGSPAEALMVLLANTVRARIAPRETLAVLAKAVEHAAFVTSVRGEADTVAAMLIGSCHDTRIETDTTAVAHANGW
jgi:hypothetical protein